MDIPQALRVLPVYCGIRITTSNPGSDPGLHTGTHPCRQMRTPKPWNHTTTPKGLQPDGGFHSECVESHAEPDK